MQTAALAKSSKNNFGVFIFLRLKKNYRLEDEKEKMAERMIASIVANTVKELVSLFTVRRSPQELSISFLCLCSFLRNASSSPYKHKASLRWVEALSSSFIRSEIGLLRSSSVIMPFRI